MHPPENTLLDTLALPDVTNGTGAPLGDRVYFVSRGRSLTAVRARTLAKGEPITLDHGVTGMATTPSGDRFYVITDSSSELTVLDPIQDRVNATVALARAGRATFASIRSAGSCWSARRRATRCGS